MLTPMTSALHHQKLRLALAVVFLFSAFVRAGEALGEEAAPAEGDASDLVSDFLSTYCIDCHNDATAEAERNFETFSLPLRAESLVISADEIVDQVTLKEMPPEDGVQPSDNERVAVVTALRKAIRKSRESAKGTGSRTVLRRLSLREYENTLARLFDRRVDTLGLTADFPKENTSGHMDNIGESLVTSGFLLDQYFQAAQRLVETRLAKPQMEPKSWHFEDNFRQYEELTGSHQSVFKFEYLCIYEQPNTDTRQGGYGHIEDFLEGVPVSGLYDIEVHAQAMHRDTHYDPEIFRVDFSEPFRIAVVPGDATKGHIHYPQAIEPVLASALVPDEEPEWLKFRVWLEAGQTPRFIFPNGPYESRASVIEVNKRYKDEFEGKGFKDGVSRAHILRHGALPHIRIGEVKVNGPLKEEGGSREEIAVFGDEGFQPDKALDQLFAFGRRAYRRPLEDKDRSRIEAMYKRRLSEEATPRQAALDTVKLILCSPSFLYLSEVVDSKETHLRPYDLAARLSYTLWAGPPDDKLLESAESGALMENAELLRQVDRLLNDERSGHFVNAFLDSWLNLREIGNLPPPRTKARDYYAENLPDSMKTEARMFFRHLIDEDVSVLEMLDADYTFVDKKLAKLYGLPEKDELRLADGFVRVDLSENVQRGGVLGMAGVLTVSANGVDTSPVTRGVWVMENILGISPPPPPDEVPEIDADVRGTKTIREKLAKHSEDKTCFVCHRRIDPLGFALETFDPIGRWRTKYPKVRGKSHKIDPSGKLPSGEAFSDFESFKEVLSKTRSELLVRNVVEKLLTYATGRHMERSDRYEIDAIVERVAANDNGLRSILDEVFRSEIFRSP